MHERDHSYFIDYVGTGVPSYGCHMYVCVYVRMCVCTYVCMYVCVYIRMYMHALEYLTLCLCVSDSVVNFLKNSRTQTSFILAFITLQLSLSIISHNWCSFSSIVLILSTIKTRLVGVYST